MAKSFLFKAQSSIYKLSSHAFTSLCFVTGKEIIISTAYVLDFRSPMALWLPLDPFHSCHPRLVCLFNLNPIKLWFSSVQFSSVQSLSRIQLFATPWIAAHQASLSITNSRSSLKLTSIKSVMPCSHLILFHPLLLLPPITPSIRVFSSESTLRMR